MEQLPPAVGMPGCQSHPAWVRTATLVPGLRVGRQAAGSSHLFRFQQAPSGAQGSASGSPSGQLLPNGSPSTAKGLCGRHLRLLGHTPKVIPISNANIRYALDANDLASLEIKTRFLFCHHSWL
ncbi:hypothetical protein NDU88_001639 [Pleurodeles waltl]|uniref:Uncharacterized protein n=1 Tax=Pleurodeles waltl TaxID=8319 RepID=A0AAV7P4S9_PLEWA|nr:hypothetical protein NDU88_001639 [Pleurodeles waltl]